MSISILGRKVLAAVFFCGIAGRVGVPQQTGQQQNALQQNGMQQAPPPPNAQAPSQDRHDPFGDKAQDEKDRVDLPRGLQEKLQLARQTERQKKLVDDTDKLLALATQLHTDVAKTNKDVLSVDVIKRADEIERLAHAVKERMKG